MVLLYRRKGILAECSVIRDDMREMAKELLYRRKGILAHNRMFPAGIHVSIEIIANNPAKK